MLKFRFEPNGVALEEPRQIITKNIPAEGICAIRWGSSIRASEHQPTGLRVSNHEGSVNLCREHRNRRQIALDEGMSSVGNVRILPFGVHAFITLPDFKDYALLWCIFRSGIDHDFAETVFQPSFHSIPLRGILNIRQVNSSIER